jgi:hypothetical protein
MEGRRERGWCCLPGRLFRALIKSRIWRHFDSGAAFMLYGFDLVVCVPLDDPVDVGCGGQRVVRAQPAKAESPRAVPARRRVVALFGRT